MRKILIDVFWWIAGWFGCTYFIQPTGRDAYTYYEKGHQVMVETQFIPNPDQPPLRFRDFFNPHFTDIHFMCIYPYEPMRWDSPHENEQITEEKRTQILQRLVADVKKKDKCNVRVIQDGEHEAIE